MVPIDRLLSGAAAHRLETGRPLVTLSYAQSLDGSLAARRGTPLRLSGKASMQLTHRLRAAHDAILVGIGTILADDPQLTVRLVDGAQPQPVILDSHLRISVQARVFQGSRLPWIATLPDAIADHQGSFNQAAIISAGAHVLPCPPDADGHVSLPDLLSHLASLGISRLMVEGGAAVITAFLTARLADLLVLTIAPIFVGGLRAPEALLANPTGSTADWPKLTNLGTELLGEDIILWGHLCYDH
jgi:3,4-dihydroxy 2-butanone 4-phosphate synthase/GTP cyclohydrolase II